MMDLAARFAELMQCDLTEKRGRKPDGNEALSDVDRQHKYRKKQKGLRVERIGILDTETDPFDKQNQFEIKPFLGILYTEQHGANIIWDENFLRWKKKIMAAIEALPDEYIIYAHNGGKFDFMFLLSELRGQVSFKGRGIMVAKVGQHELRDSFHIIPERLAAMQKMEFNYELMKRSKRRKHKPEIIEYCLSDCKFLLPYVKQFVADFGLKLSIGQAGMAELRKHYKVKRLTENLDGRLREYFFGGRVECLAGAGYWCKDYRGTFKLFDVNSMYPKCMAEYQHPVGNEFYWRHGKPNQHTIFIKLRCKNYGALVRRGENNETSANFEDGIFYTTVWEHDVALKYDLIENVEYLCCIDCRERSDFAKFAVPLYAKRQLAKAKLETIDESHPDFFRTKTESMFFKYLLNAGGFGKFAQNPRRFKEHYITDVDVRPPPEWFDSLMNLDTDNRVQFLIPRFKNGFYAIWDKPCPDPRFNNVATAASITGAARSVLLEAIQNADDPIYCDTDSLICRDLHNMPMSQSELGKWNKEAEFDEVIICGKKEYACKVAGYPNGHAKRIKVRLKGASGATWDDYLDMLAGEIKEFINPAPTFTKDGKQRYITRRIRATAPILDRALIPQRKRA